MNDRTIAETAGLCINALEATLEYGPDAPHEEIARAVRCVIDLRDHVLELNRSGQLDQHHADQANSLVSLAHGAEQPLIGVHLHRLEQTRDGVKDFSRALERHQKS